VNTLHMASHELSTHMWMSARHHERAKIHDASEHICRRSLAATALARDAYRSDMRPTARPETHQNLIYPDKDHGAKIAPATDGTVEDASEFLLHCDDRFGGWGPGAPGPGGSRAAPSPSSLLPSVI
jgi:hypothetical protein